MKWSPISFGPREVWALRNLQGVIFYWNKKIPVKKWPIYSGYSLEIWALHKNHYMAISWKDQTSRGPNFLGPKFLGDQISWWPKKSGAKMESGTISVVAGVCVQKCIFADLSLQIALSLPSFVRSKENTRYPWLFNE
jgi:hypothetical protein